ncbi:protein S100-A12 [Choloepus didactylus]|uniref:protein S100-A12 n=1 Tax=Choloepus didactylus TaxID=27675 RepID=UPI0001F9E6B8|nr:protein S100-A12 [Choloepus didactylus]XP_037670227.1 protein S100-A12 [Choloepus didactylus]
MTKLEDHLEGIVNIFHQYSVRVGHFDTLTKGELKKMIQKELPNIIKNTKDQATIDKIFQDLDTDQDGQITFNEILPLLVSMLMTVHKITHQE